VSVRSALVPQRPIFYTCMLMASSHMFGTSILAHRRHGCVLLLPTARAQCSHWVCGICDALSHCRVGGVGALFIYEGRFSVGSQSLTREASS
jgi:hypothetical protein